MTEVVKNPVGRPPNRPETGKDESPQERAARRAAELRQHIGDSDEGTDEFAAPEAPQGWSYEWKRKTVANQEDHAYMTSLLRVGWEPVPSKRHPEMMPEGSTGAIERKGMILMERPREIVEEARLKELRKARSQVLGKEAQLAQTPEGTLSRDADARVKPRIKKGYEPIEIPNE